MPAPKICRTILAKSLILLRKCGSRAVPCFLYLPAKANSDGACRLSERFSDREPAGGVVMSSGANLQKPSFFSGAAAGLVLFALAAACDSPTAPSRNPIEPSQNQTEPSRNWPDLTETYTLTLSASPRCPREGGE